MKIAICSVQEFNPSIGGIERVSNSLAEALIGRGVDVMFIACRKSPYSKEYTLPAKQYILPNSADYALENVNAFSEIVKEEKVDIILNQNAHSELYNRTCYEVKAITGVKLISAYHFDPASRIKANRKNLNLSLLTNKEYLINMLKNICTRFPFQYITMYDQCRMFRNLYYNCDKVVLLSKEFIPNYLKYANLKETDKLSAIGNMLSFPYDNNATFQKKKQILWVGRLTFSQKRPDRILKVWMQIQNLLPEWELVIVGDGPMRNKLQTIAKRKSIRVKFEGFKSPIPYYKESAILSMTSNYEGFGLVLTEAMQYGCVPIAFDTFESIHDIIKDGENGFLIKPTDIKAYAQKLLYVAKHIDINPNWSQSAQTSMEKFSQEKITDQWMNLFSNSLSHH